MIKTTSRALIETMVNKALREMKDSPERSTRNLVDMALNFSKGRFQKEFFTMAQNMLQNCQSPYYGLIKDAISNIDEEWILGFGMNLGYNSCTAGARTIREIEDREHFNIPWSVMLSLDGANDVHSVIEEGQNLGIYTWILAAEENPQRALQLTEDFPDCAFILLSEAEDYTFSFLDEASEQKNLMLAVRYEESSAVCQLLRDRGMPYSIFYMYNDDTAEDILDGELFCSMEPQHPLFAALIADETCSDSVREKVYSYAKQARDKQEFQLIPWEMAYDCSRVDSIISSEACSVCFDKEGSLYALSEGRYMPEYNLYELGLETVLRRAFPKKQEENGCEEEENRCH